jgi:hypothetical protein
MHARHACRLIKLCPRGRLRSPLARNLVPAKSTAATLARRRPLLLGAQKSLSEPQNAAASPRLRWRCTGTVAGFFGMQRLTSDVGSARLPHGRSHRQPADDWCRVGSPHGGSLRSEHQPQDAAQLGYQPPHRKPRSDQDKCLQACPAAQLPRACPAHLQHLQHRQIQTLEILRNVFAILCLLACPHLAPCNPAPL